MLRSACRRVSAVANVTRWCSTSSEVALHAYGQFDLVVIGSGGSAPQRYRGLPSSALRLGGENWIFDCGEGSMRQMSTIPGLTSMDTTKVFISK